MFFNSRAVKSRLSASNKATALALSRSMAYMGVDAINVSRQDLVGGIELIKSLQTPDGVKGTLPFISSNAFDPQTGEPLLDQYKIVEIDGLRLGIFGIMNNTSASVDPEVKVEDPALIAKQMVSLLKQKKCGMIIGLFNLSRGPAMQLVQQVSGIDIAVLGARGGLREPLPVGDSLIVQSGYMGKTLGIMDIVKTVGEKIEITQEQKQNLKIELARLEAQKAILTGQIENDPAAQEQNDQIVPRIEQIKQQLIAAGSGLEQSNKVIYVAVSMESDPQVAEWAQQAQPRPSYKPRKNSEQVPAEH